MNEEIQQEEIEYDELTDNGEDGELTASVIMTDSIPSYERDNSMVKSHREYDKLADKMFTDESKAYKPKGTDGHKSTNIANRPSSYEI